MNAQYGLGQNADTDDVILVNFSNLIKNKKITLRIVKK